MSELDPDELTAEIFKRVLRMRSALTEEEFDHLAGDLMVTIGAAALRKAEGQALRRQAFHRSDRSGNVIVFPERGSQDSR